MRSRATVALCFLTLALCSGCYEGWDNQAGANLPLPTVPPVVPAAPKPYSYILFQPISMAADATASTVCFPQVGIVQYKTTEWANRISAITTALNGLSDQVVVNPLNITATDCTVMAAVQNAALDPAPWSSSPAPSDVGGKPLLHLKASFWEGEPTLTPPTTVTVRDWAAWKTLAAGGSKAFSLTYFVISNPINGYFTQWDAAEAGSTLDGTPINQVDPTDSGTALRTQTINTDTQALVSFLTTAAGTAP